jgi:hypothetical protein
MYATNQDNKLDTMNSMIKCGADVNTKSFIGITPLMDAVTIRDHVIEIVPFRVLIHRNHRPLVYSRDTRT